jgi:hypothetical protein
MGTSGTDKFDDYKEPIKKPKKPGSGGGGGGDEGGNRCILPLRNVLLEEVARSDFFSSSRSVPAVGREVEVLDTLVGGRVAVVTSDSGAVIGFLPVDLNYLRRCIEQGFRYEGAVTSSSSGRVPVVRVNLDAEQD